MLAKRQFVAVFGLIVTACPVVAGPPLPLDLVPEGACVGIAARNLAQLRARSDRLFGKLPERRFPDRPSKLLEMALGALELKWDIDHNKPAAVVCLTGTQYGFPADADADKGFVIGATLAAKDLKDAAKVYGLSVTELCDGKVHKVAGREFDRIFATTQVGVHDGQVYLTGNEKVTATWMKGRSLRAGLSEARQKRLDSADGLIYVGPSLLALAQKNRTPIDAASVDADAQRRIEGAFLEARQVLAGYRVDEGFGLDLSVGFDPKGTDSQSVLKAVTGAGRTSNLAGLPASDRLVGAFAAVGLERGNLHLARVLAGFLLSGFRGSSGPLLDTDSALARRIFGDLYSRLRLARLAVYQGSDPARVGQAAIVLVLEPANTGLFVAEVGKYARLGDVEQLGPKGEPTKEEIEKLIADLGSDEFEEREAASTKLGLIGDAALPYLEAAEKSGDAEVRRRASELRRTMQATADLRKKELAEGLVKKAFRPTFTLKLKAEKRAGADVHLLGMRLAGEDAPYGKALQDFLGPQWNRLRIAVVNKQVVVLLGSDLELLDEAITNLRDGKPGLEAAPALAEFHKQAAPERRMELHLALGRVRALTTPAAEQEKDFKPSPAVSSISLRTGSTDAGMDLWVPADSIVDAGKWLHLW